MAQLPYRYMKRRETGSGFDQNGLSIANRGERQCIRTLPVLENGNEGETGNGRRLCRYQVISCATFVSWFPGRSTVNCISAYCIVFWFVSPSSHPGRFRRPEFIRDVSGVQNLFPRWICNVIIRCLDLMTCPQRYNFNDGQLMILCHIPSDHDVNRKLFFVVNCSQHIASTFFSENLNVFSHSPKLYFFRNFWILHWRTTIIWNGQCITEFSTKERSVCGTVSTSLNSLLKNDQCTEWSVHHWILH